jgi:hypothetical protein
MLEHERVERIAVTISFGSIERSLESLAGSLEAHRLTAHRVSVLLRGAMERLRWPYRVREFIDRCAVPGTGQLPLPGEPAHGMARDRSSRQISPDAGDFGAEETWFELSRVNAQRPVRNLCTGDRARGASAP